MILLRSAVEHRHGRQVRSGFTMIEIALCLAIIGFALVAIIGILPAGMQVQKDNREDTIINQDAGYWMEAIRNGEQNLDDLTNSVDLITISNKVYSKPFVSGWQIIGLLSTPGTNWAYARAISGPASERSSDANSRDFSFKYRMRVEVLPFETAGLRDSVEQPFISANLYEIRLSFNWPVIGDTSDINKLRVGSNRQLVRAMVSGQLLNVTNELFFFHQ
jgi:prepilin-type N-terminal cleavage/methylation domain-containing protein